MYVLEMYIRYEILRILKDRRFCDDSQGKKKKKNYQYGRAAAKFIYHTFNRVCIVEIDPAGP